MGETLWIRRRCPVGESDMCSDRESGSVVMAGTYQDRPITLKFGSTVRSIGPMSMSIQPGDRSAADVEVDSSGIPMLLCEPKLHPMESPGLRS